MTDDLLDEATRYGERFKNVPVGVMVLDLIERVRQAEADAISLRSIASHEMQMREDAESRATALSETRTRLLAKHPHELCKFQREEVEAERDSWHQAALTATAGESRAERERDEARGKLNKVRTRLTNERARAEHDYEPDGYIDWLDDTIAILDE